MYSRQSTIEKHCIIQWHDVNKEREQRFFLNNNHGSQNILPRHLTVSKRSYFTENYANEFNSQSYKIDTRLFLSKTIELNTTDLFLYGHSTTRQTPDGKATRGISIAKHYVSSAKVAGFLNEITPGILKYHDNMRIWLLSCHSGKPYYDYDYANHLSNRLKNLYGWKNKQIISFSGEVTYHTLDKYRKIASSTKLFAPLSVIKQPCITTF